MYKQYIIINKGMEVNEALAIHPIKLRHKKEAWDKICPEPSFRLNIVAPSGSGKTTLLINLLTRKEFYKGVFDSIVLFSSTHADDPVEQEMYGFVKELLPENISKTLTSEHIKAIIEYQTERIKTNPNEKLLVIFDDMASNRLVKREDGAFVDLFTTSRHFNVSIIFISQYYYQSPLIVRSNSTHLILFEDEDSSKYVLRDLGKKYAKFYEIATDEPRSFLYVDKVKKKFYKNFTKELE